eukprot:1156494-Pelagomonas_calceolata.AAC.1
MERRTLGQKTLCVAFTKFWLLLVTLSSSLRHGKNKNLSQKGSVQTPFTEQERAGTMRKGRGNIAAPAYMGSLAEAKKVPVTKPV